MEKKMETREYIRVHYFILHRLIWGSRWKQRMSSTNKTISV